MTRRGGAFLASMRALALLLLLPAAALAQPRAQAVVDAWRAGWDQAEPSAGGVEMTERSTHTFEGPRGGRQVEIEAALRYRAGQRPERHVRRVRVEGQDVRPERGHHSHRRLERAFGRSGRMATRPPPLPHRMMGQAQARDLQEAQYQGRSAWRVTLETERGESLAWFTRSARSPQLLAIRTERDGRRVVREIRYTRVRGLDLPASVDASVTARQRRRLRDYTVSLRVASAFSDHALF